jgi:hypothetical protein
MDAPPAAAGPLLLTPPAAAAAQCVLSKTLAVRPFPTASDFRSLRNAYRAAKASTSSSDPHDAALPIDAGKSTGSLVPFEIRRSRYGRGIFAVEAVAKGAAVWSCDMYGIFRTPNEWDAFLHALPGDLVYDVHQWAYVLEWDADHPEVVGIDLDEASLMNHGGGADSESEANVEYGYLEEEDEGSSCQYRAMCDILPGEEILCRYNAFHLYDHSLEWYRESCKRVLGTERPV